MKPNYHFNLYFVSSDSNASNLSFCKIKKKTTTTLIPMIYWEEDQRGGGGGVGGGRG